MATAETKVEKPAGNRVRKGLTYAFVGMLLWCLVVHVQFILNASRPPTRIENVLLLAVFLVLPAYFEVRALWSASPLLVQAEVREEIRDGESVFVQNKTVSPAVFLLFIATGCLFLFIFVIYVGAGVFDVPGNRHRPPSARSPVPAFHYLLDFYWLLLVLHLPAGLYLGGFVPVRGWALTLLGGAALLGIACWYAMMVYRFCCFCY